MLSEKLEKELNLQVNREIESAYIYQAMAAYANEIDLPGAVNYFEVQAEEELFHAKKMMHFIMDRGGRSEITGFETPQKDYESLLDALVGALNHERKVTAWINDIMDIAIVEKDHATRSFLNWYVDEQVEEEAQFEELIAKVKKLDAAGLYLIDQEMAARTFTPPQLV